MLVALAVVPLALAFIWGAPPDEEEFRFAILSTWLQSRALAQGEFPFWSSRLGFGIPLPLAPSFLLHPLAPLLTVVSPITWVRILLVAHTLLGATGMWRVLRRLQVTRVPAAIGVFSYLLATPSQNYVMSDFWPSHFIVWTSMPWLLLLAWRVLDADAEPRDLRPGVALGLAAGLVTASTNPGHLIVYTLLAAALLATSPRRAVRQWRPLLTAAGLAVVIASPLIVPLAREAALFDPGLTRAVVYDPPLAPAIGNMLLSPVTPARWQLADDIAFTRTPFFGGPFLLLGVMGGVWFGRRRPDLLATVLLSSLFLFTPWFSLPFMSARFQFRDPLTLAAIALAALALDRIAALRRGRIVAVLAGTLQIAAVAASAWPVWHLMLEADGRQALAFRGATGERTSAEALLDLMATRDRLVYTPAVDREIFEREEVAVGLGTNALAYRDAAVVNGWFKGVSTGSLSPDQYVFYGRIRTPPPLVQSGAALDVLGIRYVLAHADEAVAPGLRLLGDIPARHDLRYVLYENADPWPLAFVLAGDVTDSDFPLRDGCRNSRALCRDFDHVAGRNPTLVPDIDGLDGRLDLTIPAAPQARLLVVTQMYRPDWVARSQGRRLATKPILGGFLGVELPPNATTVQLRYRPAPLALATGLSWCALIGGVFVLARPRRSRLGTPAPPSVQHAFVEPAAN